MRFISAMLVVTLVASSAYAQETTEKPTIAIIKKGQVAPFDGVLYNDAAYADQKAKQEKALEAAELRRKLDLDILRVRMMTATSTTMAALKACKLEKVSLYNIKDERIRFLEDSLVRADKRSRGSAWWENALWFSVGAVAVIGGGWAIGQASK